MASVPSGPAAADDASHDNVARIVVFMVVEVPVLSTLAQQDCPELRLQLGSYKWDRLLGLEPGRVCRPMQGC